MDERLPRGPKGERGPEGQQGAPGPGMTRGARHAVVFLFIFALLLAGANLFWTAHQVGANNRKWCSTVVLVDGAYRTHAPATATGRQLAADFRELRREFGCG